MLLYQYSPELIEELKRDLRVVKSNPEPASAKPDSNAGSKSSSSIQDAIKSRMKSYESKRLAANSSDTKKNPVIPESKVSKSVNNQIKPTLHSEVLFKMQCHYIQLKILFYNFSRLCEQELQIHPLSQHLLN